MTNIASATKPAGSLSLSYTSQDDEKAHAAGFHFLGAATDKQGVEVHIWQTRQVLVDQQALTDILNGLFDFPYATKAREYARQIVSNSASKGYDVAGNELKSEDPARYADEYLHAQQQHFESIFLGGNRHSAEKDEQGEYVLKSVQDAWAGWRRCAGV